jgi:myosin heavy subunit
LAMDARTEYSVGNANEDLWDTIQGIKKSKVTHMGHTYYQVSQRRLEQLERRVDRALEGIATGERAGSPSEFIRINEELAEVRKCYEDSIARCKLLETEKSSAIEQLNATKASLELKVAQHKEAKEIEAEEKKSFGRQLTAKQEELAQAKKSLEAAKRANNPDVIPELVAAKETLSQEVGDLNNRLQRLNSVCNKRQSEINDLHKHVKALTAEKEMKEGQVVQLKNALKAGDEYKQGPLKLSPAIEQLIGKDGALILSGWYQIAYDDVREQTHTAFKALSKARSGVLNALAKMFKQVWQWTKTVSYKTRTKLEPWVKLVINDLKAGTLRTIKAYRDALVALETEFTQEKKKSMEAREKAGKAKYTGNVSWVEDLYLWGKVLTNQVRRPAKKYFFKAYRATRNGVIAGVQWCTQLWQAVKSAIRRRSKGKGRQTTPWWKVSLPNFRKETPDTSDIVFDVDEIVPSHVAPKATGISIPKF